jgi:hypothetical protein
MPKIKIITFLNNHYSEEPKHLNKIGPTGESTWWFVDPVSNQLSFKSNYIRFDLVWSSRLERYTHDDSVRTSLDFCLKKNSKLYNLKDFFYKKKYWDDDILDWHDSTWVNLLNS